jgi:hypothetical protein
MMPPVYKEMSVERHDTECGVFLRQAHQTGIRQRHGHIGIFQQKATDGIRLLPHRESDPHSAACKQLDDLPGTIAISAGKKDGLRKYGLAGKQRPRQLLQGAYDPRMVPVTGIQERHQGPGINDGGMIQAP